MERRATPRPVAALPTGVLWRRAAIQLATRLGVYPGDRVVVIAPPGHDPSEHLAERLPRITFLRLGDITTHAFPDVRPRAPRLAWIRADPERPPIVPERIEAVVMLFAFPLLGTKEHERLVDAWSEVLPPFGKWFELVAATDGSDPAVGHAERHLKQAGFEKVRATRLALGRMGSALFLVSGRATGPGDDEEE